MTDANKTQFVYVAEGNFGVAPTGSYNVQVVPGFQSESLRPNDTFRISTEISGSRRILDRVRLDRDAGGSIPFLLRFGKGAASSPYGFPDDWFQAALQSAAFTAIVSPASFTGSWVAKGGNPTPTLTRTVGSFVSDGITDGSWVKLDGSATAANNCYCRAESVAALTLELLPANATNDFTADAAVPGATVVQGGYIVDGTTQPSYSILKRFTDLDTGSYEQTLGATLAGMSLRWSPGDFVSGSFDFLGSSQASGNFAGTPTDIAASTEDLMNAVENVTAMVSSTGLQGATPVMATIGVTDFSFNVNNGLRGRKQVGTLGNISIGAGDFDANGTLQMYYDADQALAYITALLAKTEVALALVAEKNSKAYIFDFPRVFFTAGGRNATGKNTDVPADLTWGAVLSTADAPDNTMRIFRFF